MPRTPNPKTIDAEQMYRDGVPLSEIATRLNLPGGTVRRWKSVYKWDKRTSEQIKSERSEKFVRKAIIQAVETNDELTDRQKDFCVYYVQTYNATTSAIKAGYSAGVANRTGWKLLQKPKIREEIKRLKEIKLSAITADGNDVVDRYMRIAFADLSDFADWGVVETPVMAMYGPVVVKNEETGQKETLMQEINDLKLKDVSQIDGGIVSEVKVGKNGASIKLADRMKALEWLAKYFELNPMDQHRVEFDERRLKLEEMKSGEEVDEGAEQVVDELAGAIKEAVKDED